MYVKLISSDGLEFIVKREHALTSGTIKAMLSGPGECETWSKSSCYIVKFFHHSFVFKNILAISDQKEEVLTNSCMLSSRSVCGK